MRMLRLTLAAALMATSAPLAAGPALAQTIAPEQRSEIERIVHEYIVKNPQVLQEVIAALEKQQATADAERQKSAVSENAETLFSSARHVVIGNPKGDVTIVEYFDYQCAYCRKVHPILEKIVKNDGKIRLVLKDWPVFGPASVFAAQAVLGAAQIGKYAPALNAVMMSPGKLDEETVEKALTGIGLKMDDIAAAVNKHNTKISGLLDRNYGQALAFNFSGTPSFVIGSAVYPGFLDEKALKKAIAKARG